MGNKIKENTNEKDEKIIVAAETPGFDVSERPCFYRGAGRRTLFR